MWGAHLAERGGDQDDLFGSRSLNLRVGDGGGLLRDAARSGGLEQIQNDTAALRHSRIKWYTNNAVFTHDRVFAKVVGARRLGDGREDGRLA